MANDNTATKAEELGGLFVHRLCIDSKSYYSVTEGFTGKASFRSRDGGYDGMKEVELQLTPEMATEMMRFIAPILAQQAAKSAQQLADQAIALANEVSRNILMVADMNRAATVPKASTSAEAQDNDGIPTVAPEQI